MRNTRWILLLTIGMQLSAVANDDESTYVAGDQDTAASQALGTLLAETAYAPRWQLYHPVQATGYSERWLRPIADIEFQDNSVLGRVGKLRNLSLLTLAESGQTRLFLGVNDDGLVGLHFVVFRKHADEHYLSLARMPYLPKKESRKHTQ